jgi:hypothetical protein
MCADENFQETRTRGLRRLYVNIQFWGLISVNRKHVGGMNVPTFSCKEFSN